MADEDEVGKSGGNRTNLLNPSASMRSTEVSYLTSRSAKSGSNNTKKCVKAARGFDYLTPAAKKTFNHLWHAFTQAFIFQQFDPERHIWIKTNVLSSTIGGV